MESSARIRQRTLFSILGLGVIAILFVAVVVLSNTLLTTARIDLTEEKLFTLSEGSRSVVEEIEEPITLRFYFSDRLAREIPAIGIYAQRVRDLLEEYAAISDGKIRLEIYDPEPFTDAEDRAVAFGLQGVPVDQGGELVYFGLAGTNSTDDRQVIPFFDQSRERFLEYDITRVIYNLAHPEKRVVGMVTSLPLAGSPYHLRGGGPDDSWIVYSQMKEFFDIEPISTDAGTIPEEVDVLLLVHPKNLSDETLYAIDQYVLRGGKLLVFIDPHSEADASTPRPGGPGRDTSSNLEKLLTAWGVEMPADKVAGDLAAARRVQVPTESESRVAAIDYPLWVALGPENLNRRDPITSQLSQLNLASPGFLRKTEGSTIELTPLIQTGDRGGTVDASLVQGRADPIRALNEFEPADEPLVLAARLHGPAKSAFPEGAPKTEEEEGADPATSGSEEAAPTEHLAESSQPINVVVVADVDMLADGLWVRVQDFFGQRIAVPLAQNGVFFTNALDNLSGSSDLIGLRSRGVYQRPFTKIQEIQREAELKFRAKEQELLQTLNETERKLAELQGEQMGDAAMVLTPEQRDAIENFRQQMVDIRRELRDVQHALRSDVENLSNWIKAINIGLMPLLVALAAIVVAMVRRGRRRQARAA